MRRRMPQATYPEALRTTGGSKLLASLFGLAPGGVYPAATVAGYAVRSYRTISPLPVCANEDLGGIFSAALSVGSRPPDVIWRPVLWCPDFPPTSRSAAVQPTPWAQRYGAWGKESRHLFARTALPFPGNYSHHEEHEGHEV